MSERLTGAAKAEAERRYGGSGGWDRGVDEADLRSRDAFVAGVLWHKARGGDFTDAPAPSDDDLAVFHDHETGAVRIGPRDGSPLTLDQALVLVNRQGAVSVSRERLTEDVRAVVHRSHGEDHTVASLVFWLSTAGWFEVSE